MVLDGCTFDLSTATNGGILSNDKRGAGKPPNVVEAKRCSFTRGNATQFQGGAVANLGMQALNMYLAIWLFGTPAPIS